MNFRKVLLVTSVLLLAGQLVLLQAQKKNANALQKVPKVRTAPLNQLPSHKGPEVQTVFLKLAGSPVAVVRAGLPGKKISDAQRDAIVKNLKAQQAVLIPSIRAMGARVDATFQHALNGIKVTATPDEIAAMSKLPGVVAVKPVVTYHLDNAESVPYIGTPKVWQGPPGLHGENVKIAIIDTGIDYTHANFAGPGTPAAYQAAFATDTQPADPTMFGPNAPKVKGGYDFVGDAYDANNPASIPMPDPNPLDCNGHGSHVAGTAAGFGVTAAGTTYPGPYNLTTPNQNFIIGPGNAPKADIYALRVFGCSGSTNVVNEALDWALQNNMQVVSMSLGAGFGSEDSADAEASENLVNAGIVVIAAAGNKGPIPYITDSPSTGQKVISVAAMDSHTTYPGANLALIPGGNITVQNSNGYPFVNGTQYPVVVLRDPNGAVSLGCNPTDYTAANVTGKLVVTQRGTCARVARAIFGQQAGAAAVAMINTAAGYPPFEGPITSNPDTGIPYTVTIPFFGVQGPVTSADSTAIQAATQATATNTSITNPSGGQFASFTSSGPRNGDSHLKPEITAPGVSIFSTLFGTGYQGEYLSGTSMATPQVAGVSTLAVQAHPTWSAADVANAVVNTADATQLTGYNATQGGNGLVQPFPATKTLVSARASDGTSALSFGAINSSAASYTASQTLTLVNHGASGASFAVSVVPGTGSVGAAKPSTSSITVPANGTASLSLKLMVPNANNSDPYAFHHEEGRLVLTPTTGNNGVKLSVPYYLVLNARSLVTTKLNGSITSGSGSIAVANSAGLYAGSADFYAWGLAAQHQSTFPHALRAVGVQSFPSSGGQIVIFAVNTLGQLSNPDGTEQDIYVDSTGDGTPDYLVVALDYGLLTGAGAYSGQFVVGAINLSTGNGVINFLADAPLNTSTMLLPVYAADIGVTPGNPRFSYAAASFDNNTGVGDVLPGVAKFNAFSSTIGNGTYVSLGAGAGTTNVPVSYNSAEAAITPTLGSMVVSNNNSISHGGQAALIPLN